MSDAEADSGTTALNPDGNIPRGLAFTCYQSVIENGFEFLQEGMLVYRTAKSLAEILNRLSFVAWANNKNFPFKPFETGFDPISKTLLYFRLCSPSHLWY